MFFICSSHEKHMETETETETGTGTITEAETIKGNRRLFCRIYNQAYR